jgi:hypothetical protein
MALGRGGGQELFEVAPFWTGFRGYLFGSTRTASRLLFTSGFNADRHKRHPAMATAPPINDGEASHTARVG